MFPPASGQPLATAEQTLFEVFLRCSSTAHLYDLLPLLVAAGEGELRCPDYLRLLREEVERRTHMW